MEQAAGKDSQLEEMYGQLDSMQDINQQLETDLSLQKEFLEDKQKQLGDTQPKLMEAEFKRQTAVRERDDLKAKFETQKIQVEQVKELVETLRQKNELSDK